MGFCVLHDWYAYVHLVCDSGAKGEKDKVGEVQEEEIMKEEEEGKEKEDNKLHSL